ncbi:hypothetical protein PR048_016411 [Dryococelus australis]|uniref:Transposase n=1 Tax=Dryococelus australis TaxID=614101 RepID=A0ABQ9HJN2_9NEOP|nr:hypothetical protein PR048_016411 [Dryococelus australis]
MADTGPYAVKERLIAPAWYHDRTHTRKMVKQVQEDFERGFEKRAPVMDTKRSGRPRTRDVAIENIHQSVLGSPKNHYGNGLQSWNYRVQITSIEWQLATDCCNTFDTLPKRSKVMFSNECAVYLSSHPRNVYFWSDANPQYVEEVQDLSSLKQQSYIRKLETFFVPELKRRGIANEIYFQQDGAPAHHVHAVRNYLDQVFPNRWIGRSSPTLQWPARSPDLTTRDDALWG